MGAVTVAELVCCDCKPAGTALGEGKRRLRSLFWRVRAEVRRQLSRGRSRRQRISFHYDPFSYTLNFDAGSSGFFC